MQLPTIHILKYNVYLPKDDVNTIQKLLGKNTQQEAGLETMVKQHDGIVDQMGQENKDNADADNLSDLTIDLWSDAEDLSRVEDELISKIVNTMKTTLASELLKQNVIPFEGHVVLPEIYKDDTKIYPNDEDWDNYDHCRVIAFRKFKAGESSLSLTNKDASPIRSESSVAISFYQMQGYVNGQAIPLDPSDTNFVTLSENAERELLIPLNISDRMGNRDQMINPAKQAQYQQSPIMGYSGDAPPLTSGNSPKPKDPQ